MKLWDSLTTCLFLLSSVHASPPTQPRRQPSTRDPPERPLETPPVKIPVPTDPAASTRAHTDKVDLERMADQEQHVAGERLLKEEHLLEEEHLVEQRLVEEHMDSVRGATLNRKLGSASPSASPSSSPSAASVNTRSRARHRRGRKKTVSVRSTGGERGGGAKEAQRRKGRRGRGGQGCMLKQIHLNVSDLGLGYRSEEEMIFRYCSGPCRKSETNYDKILHNIAHHRRLGARDTPRDACCRPTAFDDDLSFLDDDLVYHTIRKHSARKCGCV